MSASKIKRAIAGASDQLPTLESKIEIWKGERRKTIQRLQELAESYDLTFKVKKGFKLGAAILSGVSAVGGITLVVVTGGAATPLVIAGGVGLAAVGIGAGATVFAMDYKSDSVNKQSKKEAEQISAGEVDSYDDLIEEFKNYGRKLRNKLGMADAPEAVGQQLALALGIKVADAIDNKFLVAVVMLDGAQQFSDAIEAAGKASEAAEKAAKTAEKAAELAKNAGYAEEAAVAMEKAKNAERAAKAAKDAKGAWRAKPALDAVKKASEASKEASVAVKGVQTAQAGRWFSSIKGIDKLVKTAEVASDAAEAAAKIAKPLARGARVLGKVMTALTPVFIVLDVIDAVEAGRAIAEGKSPTGNYIRGKIQELEDEIEHVDKVFEQLKAA